MKPKTTNERVLKHRADAKGKGWKRREYYATPTEHDKLKETLKGMRDVLP